MSRKGFKDIYVPSETLLSICCQGSVSLFPNASGLGVSAQEMWHFLVSCFSSNYFSNGMTEIIGQYTLVYSGKLHDQIYLRKKIYQVKVYNKVRDITVLPSSLNKTSVFILVVKLLSPGIISCAIFVPLSQAAHSSSFDLAPALI